MRLPSRVMSTRTENACLKGAEYANVDLGDARFQDVNLGGARFEDVSGARISDANCSGLAIENACYDRMTIDGILVTELLRVYEELRGEADAV